MAKKRKTLAQKKKALERKQEQLMQVRSSETEQGKLHYEARESIDSKIASKTKAAKNFKNDDQILVVPEKYIRQDLTKTALLSILFTAIILGLYWYLELGGKAVLGM